MHYNYSNHIEERATGACLGKLNCCGDDAVGFSLKDYN